MSKMHYCVNGTPVTDQVLLYQKTGKSDDFLPVLMYYDNFKDIWFTQLEDYMDRMTFDAEFEFRLVKAVNSFDTSAATKNTDEKGLDWLGNFNRWFYKILLNWKSNVKTSSFRLKKRPPVVCPICGRSVGRIDEEHLQHYKSVSNLPRFMVYEDKIFEVMASPRAFAVSWGKKTTKKLNQMVDGDTKEYYHEKRRVKWPWRLPDGKRGVLCPFTKNIVSRIDDEYIMSLPDKFNRYAEVVTWATFIKEHPTSLIQSEIFSLDHSIDDKSGTISENVSSQDRCTSIGYNEIKKGSIPTEYEHLFLTIDKNISDTLDCDILKLFAVGYSVDEVSETLSISNKEVKTRIKNVKENCRNLQQLFSV